MSNEPLATKTRTGRDPLLIVPHGVALVCLLLLSGCASRGGGCGIDRCADIPAGTIPEPAGAKLCNWQAQHVQAALADQTVLYRSDFIADTAKLSPAALERLARLVAQGTAGAQPWVVEPTGSDTLDSARVNAVLNRLAVVGVTDPSIELAYPAALGLTGPQAERIAAGSVRGSNASPRQGLGGGFGGGLGSGFGGGLGIGRFGGGGL